MSLKRLAKYFLKECRNLSQLNIERFVSLSDVICYNFLQVSQEFYSNLSSNNLMWLDFIIEEFDQHLSKIYFSETFKIRRKCFLRNLLLEFSSVEILIFKAFGTFNNRVFPLELLVL